MQGANTLKGWASDCNRICDEWRDRARSYEVKGEEPAGRRRYEKRGSRCQSRAF